MNNPWLIVEDCLYYGETYDARLGQPGWDLSGFGEKGWKPAPEVDPAEGVMSSQMMPAIKIINTIFPLRMTNPASGVYVFDLGQNISGWAQI